MENTARVHILFRGASQVTRRLRQGALACELTAGTIAMVSILSKPQDPAAWLPLLIVGLTFGGTGLRAFSSSANGFAQRCRRISLRAFCAGRDVDLRTVEHLDDDAPAFVDFASRKLLERSVQGYCEPTTPPGAARQAELYAHSAFFTWRLLRLQAWLLFAIAAIVLLVCGVLIYSLAGLPNVEIDRHAALEAVCTVVLMVICLKAFEAGWESFTSYREIRSIESALLDRPGGEALKDLTDSYDIERAAGASPMTFLYECCRRRLSAKWTERRKGFVGPSD
jgi:hypothetical protein